MTPATAQLVKVGVGGVAATTATVGDDWLRGVGTKGKVSIEPQTFGRKESSTESVGQVAQGRL